MNQLLEFNGYALDPALVARVDPVDSECGMWGFTIFFSTRSVHPLRYVGLPVEFGSPKNREDTHKQRAAFLTLLHAARKFANNK